MKVDVVALGGGVKKLQKPVEYYCRALLGVLNIKRAKVNVYILGDEFFKKFAQDIKNRNIRKMLHGDGFNVLSFPNEKEFLRPSRDSRYLGEIYLYPDYIRRHGEVFSYMLVHGLLHLLGYDHKIKRDRMEMEREEKRLISTLTKKRVRGVKELSLSH